MNGISRHILDTSRGQPARGVRVTLELQSRDPGWVLVGEGITDNNGRIPQLLATGEGLRCTSWCAIRPSTITSHFY